ncbi:hypothetical protein GCM10011399_32430 [Subtercola lobariae]|uniref:Sortase n=1 Tax=Subtercola lobariae TaxID=1588641 RepID=A0A917F025_9MICO|nr:hypothetical protein GCM10011399_32430 [Subtercola lobariae]
MISGVRRGLEPTFRVATAGRNAGSARRGFGVALTTVFALVVTIMLGMPGALPARADTTPTPNSTPGGSSTPDTGTLGLALAPDNAGVITTGQDLGLTVTLSNTTSQNLPATTVHVWLDRTQLTTRAALSAWLAAGSAASVASTTTPAPTSAGGASGGTSTASPTPSPAATPAPTSAPGAAAAHTQSANSIAVDITSPAIAANTSATLRTSLPAAGLGLSAWGAYGLAATAPSPDAATTGAAGSATPDTLTATSVVTWSAGAPATGATLGVIMPLTVAPGDSGLLTAAELATDTAPDGVLTTKLDSVIGRPVTLAIDPMIIVSIRVLGTAAPQSALNWLADLAAANNPTFPLSYADADLSVQRQAAAPALLTPTSFDYALSQSNFQSLPSPDPFALPGQVGSGGIGGSGSGAAAGASSASGTAAADATGTSTSPTDTATTGTAATPTPTPTPTPAAGTLPTFADLTTWNYSRTDIAWPATNTVSGTDLDYFAASGLTTSILSSDNISVPDTAVTPNAPATIGDKNVIIADSELTDALQNAVTAVTEPPRDAALAEVSAELAIVTAQSGGQTPALVASLGNAAPSSQFAVSHTLDVTELLPWAAEAPLSTILGAPQTAGVALLDRPEAADRGGAVASMLDYERQVGLFAPVIDKPDLITGEQRANLLAVLAQSWLADSTGFTTAVQTNDKDSNATLSSVQIVDGSTVNLLATNGDVPVPISNNLDQPVTVTLQVTPSNGRLVVDPSSIQVTIEAHSQKTAKVPVKAAVATGEVELGLELYNRDGVLVSRAAPLEINVSADWEGIGTLIIGILAVLFFAFAVVRLILKRRRARRAGAPDENGEPAQTPNAAPPAPADTADRDPSDPTEGSNG